MTARLRPWRLLICAVPGDHRNVAFQASFLEALVDKFVCSLSDEARGVLIRVVDANLAFCLMWLASVRIVAN